MDDARGWLAVAGGTTAAVVLVASYWLARGRRKDSLSGVLAFGLAVLAVLLPVVGALFEPDHLTAYVWVCLTSVPLAALAVTTEWRLSSVRVWIAGVALAMTPLLVVTGNAAEAGSLGMTHERLRADYAAIKAADLNRIAQLWAALGREQVEILADPVPIPEAPAESDASDAARTARQEQARALASERSRSALLTALNDDPPVAGDLASIEQTARRASRVADTRTAGAGAALLAKVPALRDTPDESVVSAEQAATEAEKTGGGPYRTSIDRLTTATTAYREAVVTGNGDPGTWPVPTLTGSARQQGWLDQLRAGGEEVLRPVVARADVKPDRWLWGTLALLALLAWWFAERRTSSHIAGPVVVTVTNTETESETKPSAEATLFRNAIRKNVTQPGTYPGAGAQPLTDLQTLVGVSEKGPIAAAIGLVKAIVSWPRGSLVDVFVVAPPDTSAGAAAPPSSGGKAAPDGKPAYRVLVTVRDAATRRQVDVKEFRHERLRLACAEAGHWAAAVVIASSPRFPRWATWSPRSAAAFAAVDTIGDEPSVTALQQALVLAPNSGLLLHRLGDALELEDRPLAALECYARAVQVDATQYRSPYRLAAVAASLSRDLAKNRELSAWASAEGAQRDAAVAALNRALHALDGRPPALGAERFPAEALLGVAYSVFDWVAAQQTRSRVFWRWASRTHRDSLSPLRGAMSPTGTSTTLRWMALSGRRTATERPHPSDAAHRRKNDPLAPAPMLYNLACCAALHDQPSEAIDLLERALTAPLAEQVTGPWLWRDPDLESLHNLPRFRRLAHADVKEE